MNKITLNSRGFFALILPVALGGFSGSALATQTDNHIIHVVPAPGPVTIDGDLKDWDLSGQTLMCYDLDSLKDVYSAQVAEMYDAANLYVSVHWVDPNPMSNSHDPRYAGDRGWAGDCLQMRIKTDRVEHLTCWYYAPKNEPAITISHGVGLTKPFGGGDDQLFQTTGWHLDKGVEMAFKKDADGKGYVQELKLPWTLLADNPNFHPGDTFRCGFELLWGATDWPVHRYADNLTDGYSSREFFFTNIPAWGPAVLEPKGHLHLPAPAWLVSTAAQAQGPIPVAYTIPKDGRVSIAIDDANGRRVRNLVPALPRSKGANLDYWDGLDDKGKPVSPGTYSFKGIVHDTLHATYVMSFANPGNPSWDTSDGRGAFYTDHNTAQAVAAAGNYVALGCPGGEAGKALIGLDLTGQRIWGDAARGGPDSGRISLATDGKTLWVAQDKMGTIYRVEAATGKYSPWNHTAQDADGKPFQVLDLPVADPNQSDNRNMTALAVQNGVLALCLAQSNQIQLLDAETGDKKATLAVPDPRAATFLPDGSLVALSKDALVRVSAAGAITPFADGSYPYGFSLASDAKGDVYLSVQGTDQNVKAFGTDGKLTGEIGVHGGRPDPGVYDPQGMREPAQIAVDSQGRIWVTEETQNPKRTAIWGADGHLIKDLAGTTSYAGAGSINPYDPTMAFSDDTVYQINLATGDWKPVYSLGGTGADNDLFPPTADSHTRVVVHNGQTYVYATSRDSGVNCMSLVNGRWISVAHIGVVNLKDRDNPDRYAGPLFAGHDGQDYVWTDKNGDGLVQADELTFASPTVNGKPAPLWGCYWGQLPTPDGTIIYLRRGTSNLVRFPITGYSPSGAPEYDIANPVVTTVDPTYPLGNNLGMMMGGAHDVLYLNQAPLAAVDAAGKVLFTYPNDFMSTQGSHNATASRPGYIIGSNSITGTADYGPGIGDVFDINGNLGENYLLTGDGLYIQALFKDTRGSFDVPPVATRGMNMDEITGGGESFGGNFVRAADGNTYLTIGGTDARVLKVSGLESIARFGGSITYTGDEFVKAQEIARKNAALVAAPKIYTVARTGAPMPLDGKPAAWPDLFDDSKPVIDISENQGTRYARVDARYDDQNLYLAYRVFSNFNRLRNSGQEPRLLFKTGDLVDLMIGPSPQKGLAGDTRLILSSLGGTPIAVLNQKLAPNAPPSEHFNFSSPWRTFPFDRVVVTPDVNLSVTPSGGGYFVEVTVPWSALGIAPHAGLQLKADFGALFADDGGTITVARHYWSNKATGLVNDVPGEAELTPELWGTITLG